VHIILWFDCPYCVEDSSLFCYLAYHVFFIVRVYDFVQFFLLETITTPPRLVIALLFFLPTNTSHGLDYFSYSALSLYSPFHAIHFY
jgi:hypothetical protein